MAHIRLLMIVATLVPAVVLGQDGRLYVHKIEFLNTDRIDDSVLRREMLQFEGTVLNTVALERSRLRLERLPYVASATVVLAPVEGRKDNVDVQITITEAPARRYGGGGGWSESQGASVHGYFVNENLLGTGQRFAARVETGEFRTSADISHTNPYARPGNVSRTIGLSLRQSDQLTADSSELEADLLAARLQYSYQIAERQSIRFGLALQNTDLTVGALSSSQLRDWVANNGNPETSGDLLSTDYLIAELSVGWHYDTRDQRVFPNSGSEHSLRLSSTVPGLDVSYFAAAWEFSKYWQLNDGWVASVNARLGYAEAVGSDTSDLPPNLNWFAGGPRTVRGYRENRLGPRDSLGNPFGGNLLTAAQAELLLPLPEKWRNRVRLGLFYDVGNVFSTEDTVFLDDAGQPLDYGFDFSELRHSVGIAADYVLPFGVLGLSYGFPLNADDENPNRFLRDDVRQFQVTFGVEF